MLGAIIGDIVGSRFEFSNTDRTDFELFTQDCCFTDDTVMTVSIADALLRSEPEELSRQAIRSMRAIGRMYPHCGYGGRFYNWMFSQTPEPYGSWGNGSAMRVSPVGWTTASREECVLKAEAVTRVTHDHPEGMKGARVTALAVCMARTGCDKDAIREMTEKEYGRIDYTIETLRPVYRHSEACRDTVPQAIEAFLESTDFESCIRLAVSLGGDSDTIAAIAGGIAEAYYGIPVSIRERALKYLSPSLRNIVPEFEARYGMRLA